MTKGGDSCCCVGDALIKVAAVVVGVINNSGSGEIFSSHVLNNAMFSLTRGQQLLYDHSQSWMVGNHVPAFKFFVNQKRSTGAEQRGERNSTLNALLVPPLMSKKIQMEKRLAIPFSLCFGSKLAWLASIYSNGRNDHMFWEIRFGRVALRHYFLKILLQNRGPKWASSSSSTGVIIGTVVIVK